MDRYNSLESSWILWSFIRIRVISSPWELVSFLNMTSLCDSHNQTYYLLRSNPKIVGYFHDNYAAIVHKRLLPYQSLLEFTGFTDG